MVGTWLSVLQQKPYSVSLKPPLVLTVAEGVAAKSRNGAHAACQLRNLQLFGCESDGLSISGSRLVDGESSDDVLGFGLQVGNLDTESFGFQADGPGFVRRGWLRHTFLINFVSKPALCNVLSSIIGDVAA